MYSMVSLWLRGKPAQPVEDRPLEINELCVGGIEWVFKIDLYLACKLIFVNSKTIKIRINFLNRTLFE